MRKRFVYNRAIMETLEMEDGVDSWNDDRLDELSRRMDGGFKEMREGFERLDRRFERLDRRFEKVATREGVAEVNSKFDRLEGRVDRLYWAFITLAVLLLANGVIGGT